MKLRPPKVAEGRLTLAESFEFTGGLCSNTRLVRVAAPGLQVQGLLVESSIFEGGDLSASRLGSFLCRDAAFKATNLANLEAEEATFDRVEFAGCRLTGCNLGG